MQPDLSAVYYPDGQIRDEDFEYGSFILSRMYHEGVTCLACHDPHTAKTRLPVEDNALCLQCHKDKIDPTAHSRHKIDSTGNRCVECHMPQTTYMMRHPRRDHGFTMPDPWLTKTYGIPNACDRCHAGEGIDWNLKYYNEWYGEEAIQPTRARGRVMAAAYNGDEAAIPKTIEHARTDIYPEWRGVALNMLQRWIGRPEVTRVFMDALEDPHPLVRSSAMRALEMAGADPETARPLLDDPSRMVRIDAMWALRASLDLATTRGQELMTYLDQRQDQPTGTLQLGQMMFDRGELDEAERLIRRTLDWEPRAADPRRALAVILQMKGDAEGAIAELKLAETLAPTNPEFAYSLGLAYAEGGNLPEAIAALERATKADAAFARA
jgi:predicted CXXCH cytochrome family protein